jgi:general secretion pathway protein L
MPQTLLLRLPPSGQEETEWLMLDEGGAALLSRQRGSLTLAAAVARSAKVVVLAPASQILLAEPELPPGGGAKLARAVPFALEEQLTEDIDQLSFAVGRRRPTGGTPVAVVSTTVLRGWLSDLQAAGLEPQALYPDISLMPENPGQTVLWFEGARLAVRRPGAMPFAVELSPVKEALVVAGVIADPLDSAAESHIAESALLYITREDWARCKDEFEALVENFASLKVQLLADGPLPWLSHGIESAEVVNLLQGEFARSTDYGARWRKWRTAAALAAALLVVHVAAQALQLRQAKRDEAQLDGQIAQVFASAMPSEPVSAGPIHDARRQMQSRLDRIRKAGGGPEYFLRSLQALSGAVGSTPKTSIDALSYREQSMDMKVMAPNLAAISQLSQYITKQGLSASIQSSTPVANGVEAHLQVRPAAKASK